MDADERSPGSRPRSGGRSATSSHLERALVHRSYCAEHPEAVSNERLEFLGDAVLGLVVTDFAFHEYPELPEGELAEARGRRS